MIVHLYLYIKALFVQLYPVARGDNHSLVYCKGMISILHRKLWEIRIYHDCYQYHYVNLFRCLSAISLLLLVNHLCYIYLTWSSHSDVYVTGGKCAPFSISDRCWILVCLDCQVAGVQINQWACKIIMFIFSN